MLAGQRGPGALVLVRREPPCSSTTAAGDDLLSRYIRRPWSCEMEHRETFAVLRSRRLTRPSRQVKPVRQQREWAEQQRVHTAPLMSSILDLQWGPPSS